MSSTPNTFFWPISQLPVLGTKRIYRRTLNPTRFPFQARLHTLSVGESIFWQMERKKAQSLIDQFHRTQKDNKISEEVKKHLKLSYRASIGCTITRDK